MVRGFCEGLLGMRGKVVVVGEMTSPVYQQARLEATLERNSNRSCMSTHHNANGTVNPESAQHSTVQSHDATSAPRLFLASRYKRKRKNQRQRELGSSMRGTERKPCLRQAAPEGDFPIVLCDVRVDFDGGPWLHVLCMVEVRKRKVITVP
jgi:hypothetical protein